MPCGTTSPRYCVASAGVVRRAGSVSRCIIDAVVRRLSTRPTVELTRFENPSMTLGPGRRCARCTRAVVTTSSAVRIRAPAVASSVPTTALNSASCPHLEATTGHVTSFAEMLTEHFGKQMNS